MAKQIKILSESALKRVKRTVNKYETRTVGKNPLRHSHRNTRSGKFPGIVYASGNRYYDEERCTETEDQLGTPITDNSTDNLKPYLLIKFTGASVTDTANIEVSYEDGDSIQTPWPGGEYWFKVSEWSTPICVNFLTGHTSYDQALLWDGVDLTWTEIDLTLPSGSITDYVLTASINGATSLSQHCYWSKKFSLPSGTMGDLLQCAGGEVWEKISGWQEGDLLYFDASVGWVYLRKPSTGGLLKFEPGEVEPEWLTAGTSPAIITFNPNDTPSFGLAEATNDNPAVLVWQKNSTAFELVELDSQFKMILRDEYTAIVGDYPRAY